MNIHFEIYFENLKIKLKKEFDSESIKLFEEAVSICRIKLKKHGLYETWKPYEYVSISKNQSFLFEEISSEIPADVNAAMSSQIAAIKNLRKWFMSLPEKKQTIINSKSVDLLKSRKNFFAELEDLEDEINGIYGKLQKGGFFSKLAKKGFGFFQRGMSSLGAGEVTNTNIDEKLSGALLSTNSELFSQVRDAISNIVADEKRNLIGREMVNQLSRRFNVNPHDIANAAHSIGVNVQGTLGTVSSPQNVAAAATVANQPTTAATAVGSKLGMPLMAKMGIGAGVFALVAAGAAGMKMRSRRKRIENLQKVAKLFGAKNDIITNVVVDNNIENLKNQNQLGSGVISSKELPSGETPKELMPGDDYLNSKTNTNLLNPPPSNKEEAKKFLQLDPTTEDHLAIKKAEDTIQKIRDNQVKLHKLETNVILARKHLINEIKLKKIIF